MKSVCFPRFSFGRIFACLIILSTFLPAMHAKGESQTGTYTLGGSTTVAPIILSAIAEFRSKHPGIRISYKSVGSGGGIKGTLDGSYLLGASSRSLKSAEKTAGVQDVPIARDAIAVIGHRSMGITDLSREQIQAVFTGAITNWKELGGIDAEIVVLVREKSSGTRSSFDELALKKAASSSSAIVLDSNSQMLRKLNTTPHSIGYTGIAYISRLQFGIIPLAIDGHRPSKPNIITGKYPLSRSLYIVHTGDMDNIKKMFIDYLLSKQAQRTVSDFGFLPVR